jgi:hypothetical protein
VGWKKLEAAAAEEGIVASGYERKFGVESRLFQAALLYLYHPSSAIFSCPLAMTDGAAKVIELFGSVDQKTIKGYRALRALIIPLVLGNTGESINKMALDPGAVFNNQITFNQPYAEAFLETAIEDAQWMVHRVAKLSRTDFEEIAKAGKFPEDVEKLVIEKLIARRNSLVKMFFLEKKYVELPFERKLNFEKIVDGQVTQEIYPGYGVRFAHGVGKSPLRVGEMLRFLDTEISSKGLERLTNLINKYLPNKNVGDLV